MNISNVIKKFSRFAVLSRADVKNELPAVSYLIRRGFVRKVYKNGRVFYELTEKALGPLEKVRLGLLAEAQLRKEICPRQRKFYKILLEDIRFLDTSDKEAKDFRFLGDWRLHMAPVESQLLLSKLRFYQRAGLQ